MGETNNKSKQLPDHNPKIKEEVRNTALQASREEWINESLKLDFGPVNIDDSGVRIDGVAGRFRPKGRGVQWTFSIGEHRSSSRTTLGGDNGRLLALRDHAEETRDHNRAVANSTISQKESAILQKLKKGGVLSPAEEETLEALRGSGKLDNTEDV